jgi:DeoR/GlpR family transcriptional regulator of sugar metabolism
VTLDLAVPCINRIIRAHTCITKCIRAKWANETRKEVGITVGDREEAYVKQAMIGASTEVVGLISLGKMGTSLPYLVGPASRLTCLITDASDEDVLNPYRSQGIEVTST